MPVWVSVVVNFSHFWLLPSFLKRLCKMWTLTLPDTWFHPFLGLAYAPIVEISFPVLAVSFLKYPLDILHVAPLNTERILTELDMKQMRNFLYQVCGVFLGGGSENKDGLSGFGLGETFINFSSKPINGIWRNLTGSKYTTSSTSFVFRPDRKTNMGTRPLIGH